MQIPSKNTKRSRQKEKVSMTADLDRRKFLKHAGTGTVALAGASVLAGIGASPAVGDEERGGIGFFFAALDSADDAVPSPASPDALLMQGCGHFDEHSGHIRGNGFFVHYDGSSPLSPKPIKATGLWEARRLISFAPGPAFGVQLTGIMVADVKLVRQSPQPEAVIPAQLTVVCNSMAIPFSTGEDEGFQLVVGNLTFLPLTPTIGISGFDDQTRREAD
jgi:hypothetical protein